MTQLLMGHCLRSPLDQLHLDFAVLDPLGCANTPQTFIRGDQVFARNYASEMAWVLTVIVGVSGPRSYQVALEDGCLWCRHIDQLQFRVRDLEPLKTPPIAATEAEHLSFPQWREIGKEEEQAESEGS